MALLDDLTEPLRGFKDDPLKSIDSLGRFVTRFGDNGNRLPKTKTRTAYALTLHATVGNRRGVIGAVYDIGVHQSRPVEDEFEIDAGGRGLPRELVPQVLSTRSISLKRYDLFRATIEQVFGNSTSPISEFVTLADQMTPISMRLTWKMPQNTDIEYVVANQPNQRSYEFVDCYFTDLGRTVSMGNVIVGSDATLTWRNIRAL